MSDIIRENYCSICRNYSKEIKKCESCKEGGVCLSCAADGMHSINDWLEVDIKCCKCDKLLCDECVRYCCDCFNTCGYDLKEEFSGNYVEFAVYCDICLPFKLIDVCNAGHHWYTCNRHNIEEITIDSDEPNKKIVLKCGECQHNYKNREKYVINFDFFLFIN